MVSFMLRRNIIEKNTEVNMNDTENYLLHKKSTLAKSIPAGFLVNLIGAIASFCITYMLYGIFLPDTRYRAVEPLVTGDIYSLVKSLCLSQPETLASLLILFFSTFTTGAKAISFFLCLWRGASLGCASSLLGIGIIYGISDYWNIGLSLSFFATVIFILLSSYSAVYSDCILKTYSNGKYRYTSSLICEYVKCFLTLSGGVIIVGGLSVILM